MATPSRNLARARAAKSKAMRKLAHAKGLNGIGLSRRGANIVLKINFDSNPSIEIPQSIDGFAVVVDVVGKLRKFGNNNGKATFHVIPHDRRWAIRRTSSQRVSSVHKTQHEAILIARERARDTQGVLVIHARDGAERDRRNYATSKKNNKSRSAHSSVS